MTSVHAKEVSAQFARTRENYEIQLTDVLSGTKTVSETGINNIIIAVVSMY